MSQKNMHLIIARLLYDAAFLDSFLEDRQFAIKEYHLSFEEQKSLTRLDNNTIMEFKDAEDNQISASLSLWYPDASRNKP